MCWQQVREVYWRLYNELYVGAADSLVAFMPQLEEEGNLPTVLQNVFLWNCALSVG